MSQAWIKLETVTPDKVEIGRIATALGMDPYAVLGRLIWIWSYWDAHSTNGRIDGIDIAFLDRLISCPDFSQAVVAVGWMKVDERGISLPHFDRHNGATAEARALTARRNEKYRGQKPERHKRDARRDGAPTHSASPEKRREEEKREEEILPQPPKGAESEQRVLSFPTPEPSPNDSLLSDPAYVLTVDGLTHLWIFTSAARVGHGRKRDTANAIKPMVQTTLAAGITPAAPADAMRARDKFEWYDVFHKRLIGGTNATTDPFAGFRGAIDSAGSG
jgi:hypothetical protein